MKNLSQKTLIFYTFQQKKQSQYNAIAYQPKQQPIKIRDVLQKLPVNHREGKYHYRFKSEFFQGNDKIIGWIDINNLLAKVPLVGGSIYIKILKVKSNAHNKMFNIEKLTKVGLIKQTNEIVHKVPQSQKPVTPIKDIPTTKPINKKPTVQTSNISKPSIADINSINLMQSPHSRKSTNQVTEIPDLDKTDLFDFEHKKPFVSDQTPQQKLAHWKQIRAAEELQRDNQVIARDQLQEKIKKWGYSGAKTVNNLTTLLSTLHDIWPQWPAISLTDLLKPDDVAAVCKKALIKTHPDKNRNKPFRQKYLSKRVFELLNDAKKAA